MHAVASCHGNKEIWQWIRWATDWPAADPDPRRSRTAAIAIIHAVIWSRCATDHLGCCQLLCDVATLLA